MESEVRKDNPESEKWLIFIEKGKEFRKKWGKQDKWDTLLNYYLHDFGPSTEDMPLFNLVYMHGRALLPSIMFRAPQVINTPRNPSFIPMASMLDSIDNWLMIEMEIEEAIQQTILNAYLWNTSGIQTNFDFITVDGAAKNSDLKKIIKSIQGFNSVPGVVDRSRRLNFPWVDAIPPQKLILPRGCRNLRTARWYAVERCTPVEDLIAQGYKGVEATHKAIDSMDLTREDLEDGMDYVHYYEIHNAVNKTRALLDCNGNWILPWEADKVQLDGLNLDLLVFNANPMSIWGTPDALYIEGQLKEGNDIRVAGVKQRRLALLRFLYNTDLIEKEELTKLYSEDAGPAVAVKNIGNKSLSEVIQILQPHTQMDLIPAAKQCLEDSQLVLGFGPNQLGTFAPGRRSKYEAQIVEERNIARTAERREEVGKIITRIFRRVNQFILREWDFPILQRVLGVEGAMYWVEMKPSDFSDAYLRDELVTSVNVESMAPVSKERQKEEAMQLFALLSKVQGVNAFPILRQLLSKFPYINVQEVLPQANNGNPMSAQEFTDGQQKLMQDPATLQQQLSGNINPQILNSLLGQQAVQGA